MRLLDRLGIGDAAHAASVSLHEYVSDRSVALFLRSADGRLDIGSGVNILLAGRRLIATASHNISSCQLSDVAVIARGERFGTPLQVRRMGYSGAEDRDVAWIELEPSAPLPVRLRFVTCDPDSHFEGRR
jgi:hypothetical protein